MCRIGILALQGDFYEHAQLLRAIDDSIEIFFIHNANDCDGELSSINGIVLPGGESTSMSILLEKTNLRAKLHNLICVQRIPTLGTCAGLILLSDAILENQHSTRSKVGVFFGALNVRTVRNFYGTQSESFVGKVAECRSDAKSSMQPLIRAPYIAQVGPKTQVLACFLADQNAASAAASSFVCDASTERCTVAAVKQNNVIGLVFHPELVGDERWHRLLLDMSKKHKEMSA